MLHTTDMTLPDLGPERPGQPSDTRQMVEQDRARARTADVVQVSNPIFAIALAVIVIGIVVAFLIAR
jgi:hypothetical protein